MWRISAAAVRHYPHLFAGMFVALSLGTGLIGITARVIFAAISVHPAATGQAITLHAASGSVWTVTNTPDDMSALISVVGLGAAVSAIVTIMVVAGAAALSISLRRRDIGLLRMAGAGKGTVRRMVIVEALVVGVPAAIAGSVLVAGLSGLAFARLNATGLAALPVTPGPLLGPPLLIAAGAGLLIALLGALAGSGTAVRTRPHAAQKMAQQEATLDSERPTLTRIILALLFLAAGTIMVGLTFGMKSDTATPVAIFGTIFLTTGFIALGPVFLPPLLRLGLLPAQAADPVPGRLAVTSVSTARRRTSSLVAPVLGVLAVVGIFATVLATSAAGAQQDLLNRDAAQLQVTSSRGLSAAELQAIRSVPGVATVAAPVPAQAALAGQFDVTAVDAEAVDLAALARTHRFDLAEGRLAPLAPGQVAISSENASWEGWHVGDKVTYEVFGDPTGSGSGSTPGSGSGSGARTATIAAIIDAGFTLPPLILPAGTINTPPPAASIRLSASPLASSASQAPSASWTPPASQAPLAPEVAAQIAARLAGRGVTVTETSAAVSAQQAQQNHINWIGLLILAGPASVYAIIGIASTIVMAASRRGPEISAMRRLGLTRFQVLRLAFWEALGTTLAGTVLAAGLVAFGLVAFRASVPVYGGGAHVSVPWSLLLTVAGGCLATNLAVSLLTTARLLGGRRPA